MKTHVALLFIPLLLLMAGLAGASYWFQVIDVTPIEMMPDSEANFTVSVKGLGSERAYVELVFKNMTDGLDFTCPKMIKNVYPAGVTKYNCTVKAADVVPGNYSFVVDVAARGSPSGKKTAFINIVAAKGGVAIEPEKQAIYAGPALQTYNASGTDLGNQTPAEAPAKQTAQKTPAPGAIAAIFAVLVAMRWMKR
ncbi:MAG: hypothetical protein NTU95_04930 [Methanothrix sp.]|nr:hypothetical protein [Methanothrix sp.]